MTSFFALLLFAIICISSLLVVSWANHIETRKRLLKGKLRVLKAQFEELQQIIAAVDQTVEPRAISRFLNEEAIHMAEQMQELSPEDGYVIAALANANTLQEELQQEEEAGRIYRIRESDSQIALSQQQLDKAAVILMRQQASGLIAPDELNSFKQSLAWARLMLSVLSYVAQGHQATNRNENLPAKAFYQKAKSALAHSTHPDVRRTQMIRELKEIIENKLVSLSPELMIEKDFNPDLQKQSRRNLVDDEPLDDELSSGSA